MSCSCRAGVRFGHRSVSSARSDPKQAAGSRAGTPFHAEFCGLGAARQPAIADTISDLAVESMALWNRLDPDAWLALFGDSVRWYYSATSLDRARVEDMARGLMSFTREAHYRVLSEPDVEVLGPNAAVISFELREVMVDASSGAAASGWSFGRTKHCDHPIDGRSSVSSSLERMQGPRDHGGCPRQKRGTTLAPETPGTSIAW